MGGWCLFKGATYDVSLGEQITNIGEQSLTSKGVRYQNKKKLEGETHGCFSGCEIITFYQKSSVTLNQQSRVIKERHGPLYCPDRPPDSVSDMESG